jgi:hypothetical protein
MANDFRDMIRLSFPGANHPQCNPFCGWLSTLFSLYVKLVLHRRRAVRGEQRAVDFYSRPVARTRRSEPEFLPATSSFFLLSVCVYCVPLPGAFARTKARPRPTGRGRHGTLMLEAWPPRTPGLELPCTRCRSPTVPASVILNDLRSALRSVSRPPGAGSPIPTSPHCRFARW